MCEKKLDRFATNVDFRGGFLVALLELVCKVSTMVVPLGLVSVTTSIRPSVGVTSNG
ncbi:MAG: hypothetical protein P4L53_08120 [Candidatus Obscuribacterales bacterium]|nr:hypothetical protein [Candidatus Obscuribacterales bacterium]